MLAELYVGHTNIVFAYAYLPFVFLFAINAMEKNLLLNSIIAGIFLAMQFHAEGQQELLYSLILFFGFLIFNIPGKEIKKRALKITFIALISIIVLTGLAAIKILPANEALKFGPRQEGFTYERSILGHLTLDNFFSSIIENGIGFLPAILALCSLPYLRKKRVMLFWALLLFVILILSGSFLYKLIWLYIPFFNKIKDLNKGFMLVIFIGSVLAAYGSRFIAENLNKKTRIKENYILIVTVILLLGSLWVFAPKEPNMINIEEWISKNEVMNYMANDSSIFRFHNYESLGIDHGVGHFSVPLNLEDIYGYDAALWHLEYLPEYLSFARQNPAKMLGILNVKYLTSITPVNISGFTLIKKFQECNICKPLKAAGPYLYENTLFLPRAYFADNAVLVVGKSDAAVKGMYFLMSDSNFKPHNTIIIKGKEKIDDYTIEYLKNFDAIFLLEGSVFQSSLPLLRQFVDSGGFLFPNVLENENKFNETRIKQMWESFNESIKPIKDANIIRKSYDKIEINLDNSDNGFLVLSEKFTLFPGWTARIDGKKADIERVNGVVSAIFVPENSERVVKRVVFEYKPETFVLGAIITSITLLSVITYLIYYLITRLKKKGANIIKQPDYRQ